MGDALAGSDRPFVITSGTGMGTKVPGQPTRYVMFVDESSSSMTQCGWALPYAREEWARFSATHRAVQALESRLRFARRAGVRGALGQSLDHLRGLRGCEHAPAVL